MSEKDFFRTISVKNSYSLIRRVMVELNISQSWRSKKKSHCWIITGKISPPEAMRCLSSPEIRLLDFSMAQKRILAPEHYKVPLLPKSKNTYRRKLSEFQHFKDWPVIWLTQIQSESYKIFSIVIYIVTERT